MANPEHLKILKQGVAVCNKWREKESPYLKPDLRWAYLPRANLSEANLSYTDLSETFLHTANLSKANLYLADLTRAKLIKANFSGADLSDADLFEAKLVEAKFINANLTNANLSGSVLYRAHLIDTNLTGAKIEGAKIYGISAWNLKKNGLIQKDLVISNIPYGEPEITVDDLEVAQFIYLMLNNQKIRDVIETITSKAVLILGRFTPERKAVLDALKDELRRRNYLPIVFDFENTENRSLTETVSLLAKMS